MKKMNFLLIAFAITAVELCSSCRSRHSDPAPYNYTNVPDGGTAVINGGDLTNAGLVTNRANTTVVIRGNVKLEALSVIGKVVIDPGATLTVGSIKISGGAQFVNQGQITCTEFTQSGDALLIGSSTTVHGKFTVVGGTTVYLQNSKVAVNQLVITGDIRGLENDATKNGNIYSVFYFIDNQPYLHRVAGSNICGPVLFTYQGDVDGSGAGNKDVTQTALNAKSNLKTIYNLPDATTFYQYNDQNCAPLAIAPGF